MSLRFFHLVFIAMSVILAVFMAAWAVGQYQAEAGGFGYVATAIVSMLSAAGLAVYATMFQRKTRRL